MIVDQVFVFPALSKTVPDAILSSISPYPDAPGVTVADTSNAVLFSGAIAVILLHVTDPERSHHHERSLQMKLPVLSDSEEVTLNLRLVPEVKSA